MTTKRKPKPTVIPGAAKLRLWTGDVVDVLSAGNRLGLTPCPEERCCGHFTATAHYQCCHCGTEWKPVAPDPNLGPEATARAWRRAPPDPATVASWKAAIETEKPDSKRAEVARRMLARLKEVAVDPLRETAKGIDASQGIKIDNPLCGVCKEPPGATYYAGVPTHLGPMDMCAKCWERWRKEKR